jgi:hypothetical protein
MDGAANVLIFANTDAASGVRNILKMNARRARGRADPDGHGQPRAYRDPLDHGAGASEHVGDRGHAGRALRRELTLRNDVAGT